MTGYASKRQMAQDKVAQPVQEPMATKNNEGITLHIGWDDLPVGAKLYTAPQQRPWVGLTETEIDEWTPEIHGVIRSIEAALRSKNT